MAYKELAAFGAGEISPEMYERGNLDKFRTGLMRLRNCTVTKMGGLRGRSGTIKINQTANSGAKAKFAYLSHLGHLFEFSSGNIRVYYNYNATTETFQATGDFPISPGTDNTTVLVDVTNLKITFGYRYIYLFNDGCEALVIDTSTMTGLGAPSWSVLNQQIIPPYMSVIANTSLFTTTYTPTGSPSGYPVDYTFTAVTNGVESFIGPIQTGLNIPAALGQSNKFQVVVSALVQPVPDEIRVYRRPQNAGYFLYLGSSYIVSQTSSNYTYTFTDIGGITDGTKQPPAYQINFDNDTKYYDTPSNSFKHSVKPKVGLVYQNRIIFNGTNSKNAVFGSRTGASTMTRDFPIQDDSAVSFRNGSDGAAVIQSFYDGRGLMIMTTAGIYECPEGALTPSTAYGVKRSNYVADDLVKPLGLGNYVTIFERRIGAMIGLIPSMISGGFQSEEFSVFSNHLLKGHRIVSWAIQQAETQVVWMVREDGVVLSFSFQEEQQLRSWAWHDFQGGQVEEVFAMDVVADGKSRVMFSVIRNGVRYIERLSDRNAPTINFVGTDGSVVYNQNIATVPITVTPSVVGDWTSPLILTAASAVFANTTDLGAVGSTFRVFRPTDGFPIDLVVSTYTSTTQVTAVSSLTTYPSTMNSLTSLYRTWNTLTGLDHLNGQQVSVRLDGFTHASPLNPNAGLNSYTVASGSITLVNGMRGAIISVGLPIVQDIQTLNVDTVEQTPTKFDSQMVNRIWLSYYNSRCMYVSGKYPNDNTVTGMDDHERMTPDDSGNIVAQTPTSIYTGRKEIVLQGQWESMGSVALRNVDPQPIQLRGIFLDEEIRRP